MYIEKVKTFHGLRWAVTEDFTRIVEKDGKDVKVTERVPVEYRGANYATNKRDIRVAVFPLTSDGFQQAKELKNSLK